MDFSFPQVAAVVGLASVVVMLVYVAALRSQYRLAQAERARTIAAEAQLKEEQRLSRSMMDNTSDLMAIYRIDGDRLLISEWNRALRRFYAGREPEVDVAAWIGRPIDEFLAGVGGLDPEAVAQRLQPFRTAAATRQPVAYSTSIPGARGPQHRESLVVPLTDAEGRVTHLFYRASDVTARRVSEAELRRSAEQFAGMFNLAPNALAIVHERDGRLLAVNDAWTRLYGWRRAEILGRTAIDLGLWIQPADREKFIATIRREGRLAPMINHLRARDGLERLCLTSAEVIDWHGEQAMLVSHQDITELETVRREAQASGERFQKLFDLSPTPIVVSSVGDARYLAVNEAWLQLHGYTRAEVEGQDALAMGVWMNPGERARIVDMLGRGVEVRGVPMRFRKKSGEVYEALYSATLGDWMGARALIATPQDVTALHRAAGEIRRLNETLEERVSQRTAELEQSNRELESFSYSVSHDLRAPLRAMSAFSALLAQRPSVAEDSEASSYASRVSKAASRMGTVVDALLHFSRLSRQEISMQSVPLGPEVEAIVAELDQAAPGHRIRWVTGPLPTVRGDPALLRLVLQNLIENAVKYSARREDAVIEIDAQRSGAETVVRVKDNGIGFEMQYADKIFGVFERLHADGEFEGTGIGLANARRIVQRHGGRIWCNSAPGEGAAFYFALPD
jgi:PAS domain S-box-containing protein